MSDIIRRINYAVQDQFAPEEGSSFSTGYDNYDCREPFNEWDAFYRALKDGVVRLDDVGLAKLADADVEDKDYYNEGEIWFVFTLARDGAFDAHYRRDGYYSSYEGREFDGATVQVVGKQFIGTKWEKV